MLYLDYSKIDVVDYKVGANMDTNERITRHSKEKLEVYKKYLETYLSVMTNAGFCPISIIEPFAGRGIDEDGNKGSTVIAQEIASTIKKPNVIHLIFNDHSSEYYNCLLKNLDLTDTNLKITNEDANAIIKKVVSSSTLRSHQLFFLDPFGYTQIHADTYNLLFSTKNTDILIFIPVYHIYRFLRKEENDKQLAPIQEFLNMFGINTDSVKNTECCENFAQQIQEGLRLTAKTDFVYMKQIKNGTCNSQYYLFFITKHIFGAEKFLEVLDSIASKDPYLFENIADDRATSLIETILARTKWTNQQVYDIGIKQGFSRKRINIILKQMEENGQILVQEIQKRRQKSFYISHDYYKERLPRLELIPQHKNK